MYFSEWVICNKVKLYTDHSTSILPSRYFKTLTLTSTQKYLKNPRCLTGHDIKEEREYLNDMMTSLTVFVFHREATVVIKWETIACSIPGVPIVESGRKLHEENKKKNEGSLEGKAGENSRSRPTPPPPVFPVYHLTRSPLTAALYYLNAWNRLEKPQHDNRSVLDYFNTCSTCLILLMDNNRSHGLLIMRSPFHINRFAVSLALKQRLWETRK